MSHSMKTWERVVNQRLRGLTTFRTNQFGFIPGIFGTEAIFLARTLLETYRAQQKDLHLLFINLEKAYNKIPREVLWQALAEMNVPDKYIVLIQDMYEGARSSVRTIGGLSNEFPIKIVLHQGSDLSPYIFALVIDQITKDIQGELPWTMLFADDVALIGESKSDVESRLETWRKYLEAKGFRLRRYKTEYLKCPFSTKIADDGDVLLAGQVVPKKESFRYLGSVPQSNGEIDLDVRQRIQIGWARWRQSAGLLYDKKVSLKLKCKFHKTVVRPAMLYGAECWVTREEHCRNLHSAEMRMLRWTCDVTLHDRIRNEDIRKTLGVTQITEVVRNRRLRWFGRLVQNGWRPIHEGIRNIRNIQPCKEKVGRPNKIWEDSVREDLGKIPLSPDIASDRKAWKSQSM
ncbi:uncharacterized protein LOC113360538 [Papaver somniferum]|uniref:uncharacterized protein LOC113360538 n=1 Tax=Papaver somniferum TaxID=3469 RepID=UPI000E6F96CD|nr:uncharacterized protein LOC113360538 [Papaver somniferum]